MRAIYHFSKNSGRSYIEKVVIMVTKEMLRRELALKTVTISPKKSGDESGYRHKKVVMKSGYKVVMKLKLI